MLCGGTKRMLDAAAVEAVDGLELVERDDHRALALGGELAGQREDFVRETVEVACGRHLRKRDREAPESGFLRLVPDLGPGRPDRVHQPRAGAIPLRLDRGDGARVAFEERQIRT